MIALLVSFILILPPNTLIFSPSRLAALRIFIANSYHWASRTARSSPMEMNCDFSSTCGDDSGFSLHPWRCTASSHACTGKFMANGLNWDTRTAISSPMEMNCDFSSTCGDDSGFSLHPWRCSASSHAWTGKFIANGLNWDTRTPISSPMEMNCDFSSTYGDDSGFPLHL